MGVPRFFLWLSRKWRKVLVDAVEQKPEIVDGQAIPVDFTEKNPNGLEFDNLYLDMNNIIHNCSHPEGQKAPDTEEEMMIAVWKALDRMFSIVRPRKVIFFAIDGVAPRAKINQQRSRRFRSAKEREIEAQRYEEIKRV
ncbi:MAG: putative 5'-3' exoribonuclease 2 [Streblomastix strix]|uniref:Putative 5'-3' exoribonuclease 2 n=1 Tax=Streblomastix strix TaxID=222440 RepID=A0A5J4UVE2_9EUKA|nr:MAG: putative 5'-3' exoribonuclease 2 [Streblomastix strix]